MLNTTNDRHKAAQGTASNETSTALLLLPHHSGLLEASAVSEAVVRARGYRSVEKKAELRKLGFSEAQRCVPALVCPVYDVTGEIAFYQIRPDHPRVSSGGKPCKYEMPAKVRMTLDCHPSIRHKLADPAIPLFITEGIRKADAAISQGLCCIALLGVWNFRGTNELGGKTVLAA